MKNRWRIIHYSDIYSDDGEWVINNLYPFGIITLRSESRRAILNALKRAGYLRPDITLRDVMIDYVGPELYEIVCRADYRPVGRIEKVLDEREL